MSNKRFGLNHFRSLFQPKDTMVISIVLLVLGFQNPSSSHSSPPSTPTLLQFRPAPSPSAPSWQAPALPLAMLRPTLARLLYSSVFIVIPLILQHSIEFRFPRETPPAQHSCLSAPNPVAFSAATCTYILVLYSSAVILCILVLFPQRVSYIWFIISQPGSA